MAFIRIKTIKDHPYAYLVENNWIGHCSRQRVRAYLGKVVEMNSIHSAPAPNMGGDFRTCLEEIIVWHLGCLGFRPKNGVPTKGTLSFRPLDLSFSMKGKPVSIVIRHQHGYTCTHTLDQLRSFKVCGSDQEAGVALAESVVNAGINLPKELFVALFEKAKASKTTR